MRMFAYLVALGALLAACSSPSDNGSSSTRAPSITHQPSSTTVGLTNPAYFTVAATASGGATLSYQWQKATTDLVDGARIAGATTSTLSVLSIVPSDSGSYRVVVKATANGSSASVTSSDAALSVVPAATIDTAPVPLTVAQDSAAIFKVIASPNGGGTLSYQWQLNGVDMSNSGRVSGVTTATLFIGGAFWADTGVYSVKVANNLNGAASVTSTAPVRLLINVPPTIVRDLQHDLVARDSGVAGFRIVATASGGATLGYRWTRNGTTLVNGGKVSGATTDSLVLTGVDTTDEATYRVIISSHLNGSTAETTSLPTDLAVNVAPVITSQPQPQTVTAGTHVFIPISISIHDDESPIYQWQKNGVNLTDGGNISGSTTATLEILSASAADAGTYRVIVTSGVGAIAASTTSNGALLTVN